jgi:ankyrin repeat protein
MNAIDVTPLCALQLLIKHKANVNALTKYGYSPLHIASDIGHLASVQVSLLLLFVFFSICY